MRTVSFVEFTEFDYDGNIFSKAIIAADVDNDNNNELVIGNTDGDLFVYKGLGSKPWAAATDLGMITCIEVGDVCNHGMNYLLTLSAEGWCHVISVLPDASEDSSEAGEIGSGEIVLKPGYKQRLPGNNKAMVIADIDGDGLNEMVIGYTDRVVRCYKWTSDMSVSIIGECNSWAGKFMLTDTWVLAGQIGSMTVNKCADGGANVMVSQPGGTFITLLSASSADHLQQSTSSNQVIADGTIEASSVIYHPLGSVRARNPGVTTEVVSNISRQKRGNDSLSSNYSAICTLDGTLTLVDDDKILWSIYVDHQLFALTKLDITGDGIEEVIACSWDGQTYIVNLSKEVVRFHFRENVAAFCVGLFTTDKDKNIPCLFYATFNNKIVVYYNITMSRVGTSNLISAINQMRRRKHIKLNGVFSTVDMQQLYHWCLYGIKSSSLPTDSIQSN